MCTVTYLPISNNEFILTSSRDVPFSREKSLVPKKYVEDGITLFYPKDGKAGGTWIGTSSKERLICLLNGGFKNHDQKDFYAKSRGLIVKELLKTDDLVTVYEQIELDQVEPFTLVIVEWNLSSESFNTRSEKKSKELSLTEFVWDGKSKFLKKIPQKPQIWSSSTLYTDVMKDMRIDWFNDWRDKYEFNKRNILDFHLKAGVGDENIDILMKRPAVGTVSITQVSNINEHIKIDYKEIVQ